jgi:hypothetical protein
VLNKTMFASSPCGDVKDLESLGLSLGFSHCDSFRAWGDGMVAYVLASVRKGGKGPNKSILYDPSPLSQ